MTIEEAIVATLQTFSAVTALTSTIRPDEFMLTDLKQDGGDAAGILISVEEEDFDNTVDGETDMVQAIVSINAISKSKSRARALSEAIRLNGTNPGTGLAGIKVTTGDLPFDAMLQRRVTGYVPNDDGSDSGYRSVDSKYFVTFYQVH